MNHKLKRPTNVALIALLLAAVSCTAALAEPSRDVLVEAEAFAQSGGWVIDQQSMDQMGSPYVLAHGLGVPVQDATTKVEFVRTTGIRTTGTLAIQCFFSQFDLITWPKRQFVGVPECSLPAASVSRPV